MSNLRKRCAEFYCNPLSGSPVDNLVDFVTAEIGRAADPCLEDTKPLVLYFCTEEDRQEFIEAVVSLTNMTSRKMP